MRTTLTLDDSLIAELKQRAHDSGRPFKEVVNETLRAGLERVETPPPSRAYSVPAVGLGSPRPGVDLDKAVALAGSLEDAELARKMELHK
ncbi:MAG: type II toxin-antitoxin system VapB family antitoxin [Xanthomonadales bacterium]|nr:type II toxin-antitoxin system VapB family antitoxin [Xanthomonadales bacterium]